MTLGFESREVTAQRACVDIRHADVAQTPGKGGEVTPLGFERGGRESALDCQVREERVDGQMQVQARA